MRIFWTSSIKLAEDGWYYWMFENWWTGQIESVFAGYTHKALISNKSAWNTVKARME